MTGALPSDSERLDAALKEAERDSQAGVRTFLCSYATIDLAGVRFANPFIRGVRFSLATGLHVLAAHERRHLWQGWSVRRAGGGRAGRGLTEGVLRVLRSPRILEPLFRAYRLQHVRAGGAGGGHQ